MASYLPYLHFSNFSPFSYCSRPVAPKGMVRQGIRATNTFMSPLIHSLDRGALPLDCTQSCSDSFIPFEVCVFFFVCLFFTLNIFIEMSAPLPNTAGFTDTAKIPAQVEESVRTSTCASSPFFFLSSSHPSQMK